MNSSTQTGFIECALSNFVTWNPTFTDTATRFSSITAIITCILTQPIAVVFNALVIITIASESTLREINSNVALSFLAATDFFSGLLSQSLFVAREITHLTQTGPFCTLENAIHFCVYIFSGVSLYQLSLVTFDRYVAVTQPYKYQDYITTTRLICAGVIFWLINASFAIVRYSRPYSPIMFFICNMFSLSKTVIFMFLIVFWYGGILMEVNKQRRAIKQQAISLDVIAKRQKDNKAVKTVLILIGALTITYIPVLMLLILGTFQPSMMQDPFAFSFVPWMETILFLNSSLNPIIYCVRSGELRGALLKRLPFRRRLDAINSEKSKASQGITTIPSRLTYRREDNTRASSQCSAHPPTSSFGRMSQDMLSPAGAKQAQRSKRLSTSCLSQVKQVESTCKASPTGIENKAFKPETHSNASQAGIENRACKAVSPSQAGQTGIPGQTDLIVSDGDRTPGAEPENIRFPKQ